MNFISLLGLLALVFCAWLLSFHKKNINFRQITWGLGLQFLFAVIILKSNYMSFVGMGVLGLLVLNFIFSGNNKEGASKVFMMALVSAVGLVVGLGLYFLALAASGGVLVGLAGLVIILLLVNSVLQIAPGIQKYLGALLICAIVPYMVLNELHGQRVFQSFSGQVAHFLSLSDYGAEFLFGNLAVGSYFFPGSDYWPGFGFQFAFKVLPTIIFFGGFMGVLYYLGIMQKVIDALSKFMRWTIGTSGAETMSCSANIFVGQTEAPLLIKPFVDKMTNSELLTIMVGGFATIAGGVLAGYIAMGVPAGHLVAASVMSAPAALVIGKIIFPELEHSETAGDVELPKIDSGTNVIEAVSNGILDGLKLAVNVGAMLIGFIALIAVLDLLLNVLDKFIDGSLLGGVYCDYATQGMLSPAEGEYSGYFPGSLKTLFGTVLRPLAFLMGVPWEDAASVGNLLGIKLSLNEFVAFGTLGSYIQEGVLSERAIIISTYALCGFANFSSIGIQIGGISAIAPKRKTDLSKLGLKAMLGGAIASWLTATIAGILL